MSQYCQCLILLDDFHSEINVENEFMNAKDLKKKKKKKMINEKKI